MLPSVKANIVDYLHGVFLKDKKRWVQRKEIERLPKFKHFSGHTITRRCQELAEDGVVEVVLMPVGKTGKTKLAWYRYIEPKIEPIVWKKTKKTLVERKRGNSKRVKQLT